MKILIWNGDKPKGHLHLYFKGILTLVAFRWTVNFPKGKRVKPFIYKLRAILVICGWCKLDSTENLELSFLVYICWCISDIKEVARITETVNIPDYVILVVGYTGGKKGWCFKILRVPAYLERQVVLSILTPFIKNWLKNEVEPAKKLIPTRGSVEGSRNIHFRSNILFYPLFYWFWNWYVYFWGQRIR